MVLDDSALTLWADPKHQAANAEVDPKHRIILTQCTAVAEGGGDIELTVRGDKPFTLKAKEAGEAASWVEAISAQQAKQQTGLRRATHAWKRVLNTCRALGCSYEKKEHLCGYCPQHVRRAPRV